MSKVKLTNIQFIQEIVEKITSEINGETKYIANILASLEEREEYERCEVLIKGYETYLYFALFDLARLKDITYENEFNKYKEKLTEEINNIKNGQSTNNR